LIRVITDGMSRPFVWGGAKKWIGSWAVELQDEVGSRLFGGVGEVADWPNTPSMEYQAIIEALTLLNDVGGMEIEMFCDAKQVVSQLNGLYKVRKGMYVARYKMAKELMEKMVSEGRKVKIVHVTREKTKLADLYARRIDRKARELVQKIGWTLAVAERFKSIGVE
jgi:ribonuclease HI